MSYSGGSVKSSEDQMKVEEFLANVSKDRSFGDDFYYHFEPFDAKLLASCYGIELDRNFESLLASKSLASLDFSALDLEDGTPVLPDAYFKDVADHLKPRADASIRERYDLAVKLLIRKSQTKKA